MDYQIQQDAALKRRGERGAVYKTCDRETTRIALAYPNTYYVGMSNLGLHTIYGLLNERPDVWCERVFLPDPPLVERHRQTQTPLATLESQTALADCDIVAFSVSFENDYLNLLEMLQLARIPLCAAERDERQPLILLGGAITAINPEPLALFIDVMVIGEGENVLPHLLDTYRRSAGTVPKQHLLETLAQVAGVYVPALYDIAYHADGTIRQITPRAGAPATIEPCPLRELARYPAYSRILTDQTEFGKMFLVQINRGCCYQCRFCHTGYTQRPVRHLPFDVAQRLIEQGLQERETIGLVGAAVTEYPELNALCHAITSRGGRLAVSSLRISTLAQRDAGLLAALVQAGQHTVTLAPEAGTERLRRVIQKGLADQRLFDAIEYVFAQALVNLKLYFLIGLPTETDHDVAAMLEVAQTAQQIMEKYARPRGRIGRIILSVNPFVPKPFTPLQWCAMETEANLKRKLQILKRGLRQVGNVELIHELPKWATWQGILARGDRRLGEVLLQTFAQQGNWKQAFRAMQRNADFYVSRHRTQTEILPWSHLHIGNSQDELWEEYQHLFATETLAHGGHAARAPVQ